MLYRIVGLDHPYAPTRPPPISDSSHACPATSDMRWRRRLGTGRRRGQHHVLVPDAKDDPRQISNSLPNLDPIRCNLGSTKSPQRENLLLFDAREPEEYAVSHLQGAQPAPSKDEALKALQGVPANQRIVLYCSVGYRSSELAQFLMKKGYTGGLQSGRIDLRLGKRGATSLPGKRAGKGRPSL